MSKNIVKVFLFKTIDKFVKIINKLLSILVVLFGEKFILFFKKCLRCCHGGGRTLDISYRDNRLYLISLKKSIKVIDFKLQKYESGIKMKKVLILCTGNSCRSIIAEALINAKLDGIKAYSSGVRASGRVNPNAKRVLEENGIWKDEYHSKTLDTVIDVDFDLIVTVCDHAKESCPIFPKPIPKIHIGFEDPDGKGFEEFEKTYKEIEEILLPEVEKALA